MAVDVNAAMAGHARAAAAMVWAEYGQELDFSEPTIGAVEALLNTLGAEGDEPAGLFARAALLFGAYVGEIVRGRYPQATGVAGSLTPDAAPPFVRVGDVEISPVVWCFKRLHNGPADSVVDKFLAWIPTEPKTPNDCPTPVIMARCVGVLVLGFTPRSAGRPRFD